MIRAKMYVESVQRLGQQQAMGDGSHVTCEIINMRAVTGKENEPWSLYTPTGHLGLTVTNPNCFGKLTPGSTFYIDITPVE